MTILLHIALFSKSDHEEGEEGFKIPKNLNTWFMDDLLGGPLFYNKCPLLSGGLFIMIFEVWHNHLF